MSEMKLIATGPFSLDKYDTLVGANGRTVVMTGVALAGGNGWGDVPLENTKLLLEALTVHHETGMTPRELAKGYQEMRAALAASLNAWDCTCSTHGWDKDHLQHAPDARAALAKHKEV